MRREGSGDKKAKAKGGGEQFFEPPESLPASGSLPEVHALDPAIEAARREMEASASDPLVGEHQKSSTAPPSPMVRARLPRLAPQGRHAHAGRQRGAPATGRTTTACPA